MAGGILKGLIVEDNPGDVELLLDAVASARIPVDCHQRANTLEAAVKILREDPPEIIFLDLSLPDASNKETLETIQKTADDIPVVIVTGQSKIDPRVAAEHEIVSKGELDAEILTVAMIRVLKSYMRDSAELHHAALVGRRVADTAHDLIDPLSVAQSNLELVIEHLQTSPSVEGAKDAVSAALDAYEALTAAIVTAQSLKVASPPPRESMPPFSLSALVFELVAASNELLAVDFVFVEPDEDVWVRGNFEDLHRVLLSAIKLFAEQDSGRVLVTVERVDDHALLAFRTSDFETKESDAPVRTESSPGHLTDAFMKSVFAEHHIRLLLESGQQESQRMSFEFSKIL